MKKNHYSLLLLLALLLSISSIHAQRNLWTNTSQKGHQDFFKLVSLDDAILKENLSRTDGTISILLPLPDGSYDDFLIVRSGVMAQKLAEKYPNIQTFKGISTDGKKSVRLDYNGTSFYASVKTEEGLIYIDPNQRDKPTFYKSYYVSDYKKNTAQPFFEEKSPIERSKELTPEHTAHQRINTVSDGELRKYRIAIAADSEYSEFHGGTIETVLSAIVTTLNRVNGIYENDLSVTFELVADNDEIIFLNSSSDPFSGLDTESILNENSTVINSAIGMDNYDIGHSFTTGSGGLAGLGVVCTSSKASGTTGINSPVGDVFDVDFVAHEIGHQFGGNHTFNGDQSSCSGLNRNSSTAYEPGSGSTIMAYAGICGGDNLQNNSDPFFHAASLDEMISFITTSSGSNCPTTTTTGNNPPVITIDDRVYTIPANTPFRLTATGSDVDEDDLSYSWEQYDLGPSGSPLTPEGTAPLFRAFNPTSESFRVFPKMEDILEGTNTIGELLPNTAREMNFRVVLRDNNPNGGAIITDDVLVMSDDSGDAFEITSQSTQGVTYIGGTYQEITWEIGNTNTGNIATEFVKISLSSDGGQNFDHMLTESTSNDGLTTVLLPEIETSEARIKIEAIDNIFFNINDQDFEITLASEPDFTLSISPIPLIVCVPDDAVFEVFMNGVGGFDETVTLTLEGLNEALTVDIQDNTLNSGESTLITIGNTSNADETENGFTILASSSSLGDKSQEVSLSIYDDLLSDVNLSYPIDDETNVSLNPTFEWEVVEEANTYSFGLALDENFNEIILSSEGQANSITPSFLLEEGVKYYWRVSPVSTCGVGNYTATSFSTLEYDRIQNILEDLNIEISDRSTSTITSTLMVAENVTIDDLNLINLDITHTWIQDLTVTLESPSGTKITIFSEICGDENDVFSSFDDQALETSIDCPPLDNDVFQPENPLSVFNDERSEGVWILEVIDSYNEDGGSLNGWGLDIGTVPTDITLTAIVDTPNQIDLSWQTGTISFSITGYEIEMKEENSENFSVISSVTADITSLTITDLKSDTFYDFRVVGQSNSTETVNSDEVQTLTLPDAPIGLQALYNENDAIDISWTDNYNWETGFVLEISTDGENYNIQETIDANQTSFIFSDLNNEGQFFVRIKALNSSGESDYSEVISILITSSDDRSDYIQIFPNPGNQLVEIKSTDQSILTGIQLIDVLGKRMKVDIEEKNNLYSINTSSLKNGLYFVQIISDGSYVNLKWIKK